MSLQITILKVLAGHPGGRASLDEVRHAVSFLMSSGADWTNRMKRLAALAPDLNIFGSSFAVRDNEGWKISDAGRQFLILLEAVQGSLAFKNQPTPVIAIVDPPPSPPMRLVGIKKRRPRRGGDRTRRAVA